MSKTIKNILGFFLYTLLTALAAFFSAMAFPSPFSDNGIGLLIFVSYIPIFLIINKVSFKSVWFYGWEYGFIFYLIYNYWLKTFHPLAILIAPILESFQYLLLFLAIKSASLLFKRKRYYITETLIFTLYYYLTQQGFLGYPYGNPASALYAYPIFLQSGSIFGIWLITILILLPQAMIAEMILKRKIYKWDILVYLLAFLTNILGGLYSINSYNRREGERTIRVAAVQHSADSWEGGYTTYKNNFETLKELSLEAMKYNPDFVAWSETAFVPSVAWHLAYPSSRITSALVNDFLVFGKTLGVPLITGNPEGLINDNTLPAFLPDGSWNWKTYNTVILFGDNEILGTYRKQHLVPFTEHFPYEKQFPRLYELLLANDYKWWEEGEEETVFSYDGISFSTPICFEDTFGYLSAEFVNNGADLLINLTNDSWSGAVSAEMQHMQLATMRAIENRRPLLRSTNSGITCLITEDGEIHNPLEPFTKTFGIYDIEVGKYKEKTFYTEHPDLLPKLLIFIIPTIYILGIGYNILKTQKDRNKIVEEKLLHLFDNLREEVEC